MVESLRVKIESLETENKNVASEKGLNTNQAKPNFKEAKTVIPKLFTKRDRILQGVSKFMEGIDSKTNVYRLYRQWYDNVVERMEDKIVYSYNKHLLICSKNISISGLLWQIVLHSCSTRRTPREFSMGNSDKCELWSGTLNQG